MLGGMRPPRPRRYGLGAPLYDVLSMERLVYRAGRVAAIARLDLREGDRVLDVGCGTGLNLPLLVEAVGRSGHVVGIDASPSMLRQAERRIARHHWTSVSVAERDAGALSRDDVGGTLDAVLFTYSLSIIDGWESAWTRAWGLLREGGRVAVVDTAPPVGRWRLLSPLARAAMLTGGVHASRRVWRLPLDEAEDTQHEVLKGGHVQVAVGTKAGPGVAVGSSVGSDRDRRVGEAT